MSFNDMRDTEGVFQPRDLLVALALLTRLPLRFTWPEGRTPAAAAWAYPLVGAVVGGCALVLGWMLHSLGAAPPLSALCILACMIILTGAMHEDGLADCADGFWGGWERERRLDIMKDSQIGTYGVLALGLSLLLRWTLLTSLIEMGVLVGAVLVAAILSRAAMVGVMHQLPNARPAGLSARTGRPGGIPTGTALLIGAVAACLAFGLSGLWLIAAAALAALAAALIARAKIAGQTGDVLGATQQMVEIAVLMACHLLILNAG